MHLEICKAHLKDFDKLCKYSIGSEQGTAASKRSLLLCWRPSQLPGEDQSNFTLKYRPSGTMSLSLNHRSVFMSSLRLGQRALMPRLWVTAGQFWHIAFVLQAHGSRRRIEVQQNNLKSVLWYTYAQARGHREKKPETSKVARNKSSNFRGVTRHRRSGRCFAHPKLIGLVPACRRVSDFRAKSNLFLRMHCLHI